MIINAIYPELKGRGETLDLKSLGPSTFGLMKKNRKEDESTPPVAIVAEEHVPLINVNDDDDDDDEGNDDEDEAQPDNVVSPILNEGPNVVHSSFEAGSSSATGGSSTPQPAHNASSERLARFLAQQYIDPTPQGKGISIGSGSSEGVNPSVLELKAEIGVLN
ncbi:unnamed protein product [Lactuca saligna]|uniref:Uncharacterized protein n=1 Tax=Lactuca saligna TaxID=75948 RepID=A0AA36EEY8_LACSI|nr:unnamed protein product [Lactuca saligna]